MNSSCTPATRFLLALAAYFLLHVLVRIAFSDSMELDEAEQYLFSQWLHWGYSSQPPLYTWLQKAVFSVLGDSIIALALMKNLCLFVLYTLCFHLARRVLQDENLAMRAACSLLLMPPIAWEAARDLTHTVLVSCWVVLSILMLSELLKRRTWLAYAGLGCVLGLGVLSKYNYTLHILALTLALMTLPDGRRLLLDGRILLTLLSGLALYAPHGLWILENQAVVSSGLAKLGQPGQVRAHDLSPLWKLGTAIAAYVAPVLLIVRGFAGKVRQGEDKPVPAPIAQLLGRYFLILLLALLLAVWFVDAGRIRTRWLFPFMVLFPVWLFTRVPANRMTPLRSRMYLGLATGVAACILILMLIRIPGAAWTQKPTDLNLPFSDLATDIRQAGFTHGVIVAANAHIGGNLHHQFGPDTLILTPQMNMPLPDSRKNQPILAIWEVDKTPDMPEHLHHWLRQQTGQDTALLKPAYLQQPYRYSNSVMAKLGYLILGNGLSGSQDNRTNKTPVVPAGNAEL